VSVRVLHVLHSAWPDVSGGSIRSRYVVETQAAIGIAPVIVSGPFQPPADPGQATGVESLNGIAYHRTFEPRYDHRFMQPRKSLAARARKLTAVLPFARRVRVIARAERARLIHGHSIFYCGLAAALAARSLGLPSVYEVRSLIEYGLAQEGGTEVGGLLYRAYRAFDRLALALASHVVVISQGLRSELIARGIPERRITVIANGVDTATQQPAPPSDPTLLASLGFPADAFVVGYIGTLLAYESLEVLFAAAAASGPTAPELRLLVVGDGPARERLVDQSRALGLADRVRFVGRVPHEAIGRYYGLVDLFVLPRLPTRLTDLVTPLKPLEIMARAKPVLASDCGGHREVVVPGENGFLYDARAADGLARALLDLRSRRAELPVIGARARSWVGRHRSWQAVLAPTPALYNRLVLRTTGAAAAAAPVAARR